MKRCQLAQPSERQPEPLQVVLVGCAVVLPVRDVAPSGKDAAAQKPHVVYGAYVLSQTLGCARVRIRLGKGLAAVHMPTQGEHIMGQPVEVAGWTVQRVLEALEKFAQVVPVNPAEQAGVYHVLAAQGLYPLGWDALVSVQDAGQPAGHTGRRVGIVAQVYGSQHAVTVVVGMFQAPDGGVVGIPHVSAAGASLLLAHVAGVSAVEHLACVGDHVHAGLAAVVGGVGDRAYLPYVVVGSLHEHHGQAAHERTVALAALTREPATRIERLPGGIAVIENVPVGGVCALVYPFAELGEDVVAIDVAQLAVAVAERERHGRVVAPRARGLVVRAMPHHVGAGEAAARHELVGHAERIAHSHAVCTVPHRPRQAHGAHLVPVHAELARAQHVLPVALALAHLGGGHLGVAHL